MDEQLTSSLTPGNSEQIMQNENNDMKSNLELTLRG